MKKLLVLTVALALFAAPAFAASIVNGPHDLSDNGIATNGAEVCVYCHTPHSALSDAYTDVPLWNIKAGAGTIDLTSQAGPSAMCMACHDGAIAFTDMSNPTGVANGAGTYTFTTYGFLGNNAATMLNDHPVGINYTDRAAAKPGEFLGVLTNGVKLSTAGNVECFSCHDVHNMANAPFLISTNAGSALCLGCHIK